MATVAGLHALGRLGAFRIPWSDLPTWLDQTPFEDVVGAVLLVVALALAYWLLVSTVAYLVATASGRPRLIRAVDYLTLPPIRRLTSRVVALALAASTVAGPSTPAVANLDGVVREVVLEDREEEELPAGGPSSAGDVGGSVAVGGSSVVLPPHLDPRPPSSPGERIHPPAPDPAVPDATAAHTVTVSRGDHMWGLAEAHLGRVTKREDLGEHEIARYWVRVIRENRSRIRSGNPDLIYPGETLVLPPVER